MALSTSKIALTLLTITTTCFAIPNIVYQKSNIHNFTDFNKHYVDGVSCNGDPSKYNMRDCIDAIGNAREHAGDRIRRKEEVVIAVNYPNGYPTEASLTENQVAGEFQIHVDIDDNGPGQLQLHLLGSNHCGDQYGGTVCCRGQRAQSSEYPVRRRSLCGGNQVLRDE